MQQMPDKEFDKVFRDNFESFEVEPSANLWPNIAVELAPTKKAKFPFLWVAAASATLVLGGLLLIQSDDKIYLQGDANAMAANASLVNSAPSLISSKGSSATVAVIDLKMDNDRPVRADFAVNKVGSVTETTTAHIEQKNILANVQPNTAEEHKPIKRAEIKPIEMLAAVAIEAEGEATNTVYYASNFSSFIDDDLDEATSKKGIRNVGDLVNYVVDKVDRRDKKVIKFTTDDDDNTSIIGLNIGFIKLNKKK